MSNFTSSQLVFLPTILVWLVAAASLWSARPCQASSMFRQEDNNRFFRVAENAPSGTCVGRIRSSDGTKPDVLIAHKKNNSDPHQEIISDQEIVAYFNLTADGDLVTVNPLDREKREYYRFVAMCMSPFSEISITIQVEDVNDNAPKFYVPPDLQQLPSGLLPDLGIGPKENISSIVVKWPEGQSRIPYDLPVAIDLDIGANGIQEFILRDVNSTGVVGHRIQSIFCLIEHGAPSFSNCNQELDQDTPAAISGAGGQSNSVDDIRQPFAQQAPVLVTSKQSQSHLTSSQSGGLIVHTASSPLFYYSKSSISLINLKPLDRETQPRHQFVVHVIDGGQPPLVGRLLVTVEVTDINDNEPIFEKSYYEIRVKENITVGSSLLAVVAHDADLGANAQLSYHLHQLSTLAGSALSSSSSSQPPIFKVDPMRGEIFLNRPLDYESDTYYELRIEARDHGQPSRSGYTKVKVIVEDVDDDPPAPVRQQQQATAASDSAAAAAADPRKAAQSTAGSVQMLSSDIGRSQTADATAGLLAASWTQFAQINSPSLLFVIILIALFAVAFSVCLVKIRSRQPESDYEDTALTLNNGQTKQSPNHSISNHHHDQQHQHHHHHQQHPHQHQHERPPNSHHSSHHNQYQVATLPLHSSSSRHQGSQLPHTPYHNLLGGSFSHWPRTPGSTMGCFMSGSGHALHAHGAATIGGGGPGGGAGTPASTLYCVAPPESASLIAAAQQHQHQAQPHHGLAQQHQQPLDRWFDTGVPSQLVLAQDLYGSYNWDYLADWAPDYQSLMPIVQSYRKQPSPWSPQWTTASTTTTTCQQQQQQQASSTVKNNSNNLPL